MMTTFHRGNEHHSLSSEHEQQQKQQETNNEAGDTVEEWSIAAAVILLEAYESRLSGISVGNLKVKDWDEVASIVNRRCDSKSGVKSVNQCKRKVYALRRWYKSVRSKEMAIDRADEYRKSSLFAALDRILSSPYPPCRAGIPGGVDAGERMSMPMPSSFDEEEEESSKPSGAGGNTTGKQLGKRRARNDDDSLPSREGGRQLQRASATAERGNFATPMKKKPLQTLGNGVADALGGFARVLSKIERAKMEIMMDLDARRTHLQVKLEGETSLLPGQGVLS